MSISIGQSDYVRFIARALKWLLKVYLFLFGRYHGPESVHTAMRYYSDLIYSGVVYLLIQVFSI